MKGNIRRRLLSSPPLPDEVPPPLVVVGVVPLLAAASSWGALDASFAAAADSVWAETDCESEPSAS